MQEIILMVDLTAKFLIGLAAGVGIAAWLNNDWVNIACTLSVGLLGILMLGLLKFG